MEFRQLKIRWPQQSASMWCNLRHEVFCILFYDFLETKFSDDLVLVSLLWTIIYLMLRDWHTELSVQIRCEINNMSWNRDSLRCIYQPNLLYLCDKPLLFHRWNRFQQECRTWKIIGMLNIIRKILWVLWHANSHGE